MRGGVTKRVARLTRNRSVVISNPNDSLSKTINTHCLVVVGSRNGFKREYNVKNVFVMPDLYH